MSGDKSGKDSSDIPKNHETDSVVISQDALHGDWLIVQRKKRTPIGGVNVVPNNKGSQSHN